MSTSRNLRLLAVATATAAAGAVLVPGSASSAPSALQTAKAASAKYHSLDQAARAGYSADHEPCVSSPDGTMGTHHVSGARIADGQIDPLAPEILLYAPGPDGDPVLVGVEYLKFDRDQNLATDDDRPTLFGQAFDGPMPGHGPGMPVHYDLHVWFWADNPSGMFAPFNPSLSCD